MPYSVCLFRFVFSTAHVVFVMPCASVVTFMATGHLLEAVYEDQTGAETPGMCG